MLGPYFAISLSSLEMLIFLSATTTSTMEIRTMTKLSPIRCWGAIKAAHSGPPLPSNFGSTPPYNQSKRLYMLYLDIFLFSFWKRIQGLVKQEGCGAISSAAERHQTRGSVETGPHKPADKSEEVVEYLLDKSEEVVDYAKKQRWWNKVFGKNSGPVAEKYDVATQLAIGGVSGWCAGYLFQKVGKLAASAVGGGFFLLQIANHTGYIKVDWKRVERDVNKAKKQLKLNTEKPSKEVRTKVDEVQTFVKKNIVLTGGFAGGFLLGLAS
uniref:FUN14 domain-containing protein 2 n=1 Tax=Oncorhynchus mykiss TaxID=8022 RepID=A0A8C7TJQ1_ONCMY